jgi:hypothetical protein
MARANRLGSFLPPPVPVGDGHVTTSPWERYVQGAYLTSFSPWNWRSYCHGSFPEPDSHVTVGHAPALRSIFFLESFADE